jgi:hypothetical protein
LKIEIGPVVSEKIFEIVSTRWTDNVFHVMAIAHKITFHGKTNTEKIIYDIYNWS